MLDTASRTTTTVLRGAQADSVRPPPASPRGDGDREPPRDGVPLPIALAIIVLIAVLLTYLGMETQVWANLTGAQLPGA